LDSYFGKRFEKLCQESLMEDYRKRKIIWEHVGRYWDKNIELDVVGIRRDRWIDMGECKWGTVKSLREVAQSLEMKSARYPNAEGASIGKHIYLRTPVSRQIEGIQLHTLSDMF
jgi:AAA+ ATPase superfamily predicted ATPase